MTDTAPKFEDIKEAADNVKTELVDNILTPPEIALEMTISQDVYVYYREGNKVKKATIAAGRYLFSIGNKEGDIAPELVKRIKANVPDDIEASNAIFAAWLYRFNIAPSELERVQETGEITGHFLPVRLSNRPNSPLTYGELLNWVIAQGLKKTGNPEAANWFKFALDISSNPDGIKLILNEQDTENETSAETTSKKKALIKYDSKRVIDAYQSITKLSKHLTRLEYKQIYQLDVSGDKEPDTNILISLNNEELPTSRPYSLYDLEIDAAITKLMKAGNRIITPSQICRARTGSKGTPRKTAQDRVIESIMRRRTTFLNIDYTELAELRAREGKPLTDEDGNEIKEGLINKPGIKCDVNVAKVLNKQTGEEETKVVSFIMDELPATTVYAETTGRLFSYKQQLLKDVAATRRMDDLDVAIFSYIMERINQVKTGGNNSIKFETLNKRVYDGKLTPKMERTIREDVLGKRKPKQPGILDALKAQGAEAGGITDYTVTREGSNHRIVGIKIYV